MSAVRTIFDLYICHSREDLVRCMDAYCTINGRAKTQSIGETSGGGSSETRYDMILRQNAMVDRVLPKLRSRHHLSYMLLDSFYRQGLHEEHDGWIRCLMRAQLPYRPQTARERMLLEQVFEGLLVAATDSLFGVVKERKGER